ncbi:MAG: MobC family plasmid mobilization relaxosome protein [Rikenellaceae bacterium]|nr:MobC family plasmid mobilization relaxosome protein [Rikenellaceae bacterium]
MSKNKKGGRPKKGDTEKLQYRVAYMLPTVEYYALKRRAKNAGLSLAEISRQAVTGARIVPRLSQEESGLITDLNRIGNNLNQLARATHTEGFAQASIKYGDLADEIDEFTKRIRNDGKNHKR